MELDELFTAESKKKKLCYVHINDVIIRDSDFMFHIDLGSCASVVLAGRDAGGRVWLGINHLFKSREKNDDLALQHIAELYNALVDKQAVKIQCLALFGAGYREKSYAKNVAQMNIRTILEALSFYNLSIEIFQTGFSQNIRILKSDDRDSFIIKHMNLTSREVKLMEVPLGRFFG